MDNKLDQNMVMKTLDWAYEKSVNGLPGLDSAKELANCYMSTDGNLKDKVNSLIRWQNTKAGTSGFITGLGGIITLPVAIPANMASVIYIQVRMIAAIAYMAGHDLKDDRVKTLSYVCLTGNGAKDILKEISKKMGSNILKSAIKNISGKTLVKINQRVGFRLLTKFGEKGVINLGKAIPLIGGVIGGVFDSTVTNTIGNVARKTFLSGLNPAPVYLQKRR